MRHIGSGNIEGWTGVIHSVVSAKDAGQISGKYLFNEGHILYSKVRPNLAKTCYPRYEGVCSADIYPLMPIGNVDKMYLLEYLLTEKFVLAATEVSERTGMPKINRQDLSTLKIKIPPINEQKKMGKIIEAISLRIGEMTRKYHQTQSLKKSLMQDLLTGKVRVTVN